MKIGVMDGVLIKPWTELFDEAARLGFDGYLALETEAGEGPLGTPRATWRS